MNGLLVAHGTDAVLLAIAIAGIPILTFRALLSRCIADARLIESRNPHNAVGVLGRRIIDHLERLKARCDLWRDVLAIAAVFAALASRATGPLSAWL